MWGCFALLLVATVIAFFFCRARFPHWIPRVLFPLLAVCVKQALAGVHIRLPWEQ